jgi:Flp pilus assembly protein TadD
VQVLGVMPHLHYLGKEVQGFATMPNGARKWLILIKHWDFNWQGEFRYAKPVFLPKGAMLTMRYSYDNSAENPRNPKHTPQRVTFGPQSTDEMGELWLQVLPGTPNDLVILERENKLMISRETAAFYENFLRAHPDDAPSHLELGKVLGPLGQTAAAAQHLQTAVRLDPNQSEAHYFLGNVYFNEEKYPQARAEFESELRLHPNHSKAHVRLGLISIEEQHLDEAETHLRTAVRVNPKDSMAQEILARIVKARAESKP